MAVTEQQLIGALIGLARATNGGCDMTEQSCAAVLSGLACDAPTQSVLDKVRNAKFELSPSCQFCANPCGRTDDYDMSLLEQETGSVRTLKLHLLDLLHQIARAAEVKTVDEEVCRILLEGLFRIGYPETVESLTYAIKEEEEILQKLNCI